VGAAVSPVRSLVAPSLALASPPSAAAAIFAESQELKSFAVSVQQRRSAFVYDACKRRPR
jgi:hypothetical protein